MSKNNRPTFMMKITSAKGQTVAITEGAAKYFQYIKNAHFLNWGTTALVFLNI